MIVLCSILFFSFGAIIGAKVYKAMLENNEKEAAKKVVDEVNKQFKQILNNLTTGFSRFKSRVNATVHIESVLDDYGNIDIIYLMDKNDIAIFQGNKCLYTSDKVDKTIVTKITTAINTVHGKEISEVVNFFGLVFSKDEFERNFRLDFEQLQKTLKIQDTKEISDVEEIIESNSTKFDIDEILDKISANGLESLTPEERIFLDNYSNEKGN